MHQRQDDPWSKSDPALVASLAAGDRAALDVLYERHKALVFGCLCRLTPDRCLAEELLQDTFLAAWQYADRYRGQSSVRSWFVGIARRKARDRMRRAIPTLVDDEELAFVTAPDPALDDIALARIRLDEIAAAIGTLAPIHQEVLFLVFRHQFAMRELAATLEIPIGTAKSRLNHARLALLDAIGQEDVS